MNEQGLTNVLLAENMWYKAEVARLRALIDGLECAQPAKRDVFYSREDGSQYFRVENVPCGKCGVCKAKQAAAQPLDGEVSNEK